MIICFVVDVYKDRSNGTSMSAFRSAKMLRQKGYEVRIVAVLDKTSSKLEYEEGEFGEKLYLSKENYIPLVSEISHKQHMRFAKPDINLMKRAFKDCDIVHFFLPFALEIAGIKLCKELKIPYTTAFHLQPQHISYNMNFNFNFFNDYLYRRFYKHFYSYAHHIHCPSKLMQDELNRIGYKAKTYVISNGFELTVQNLDAKKEDNGFFNIVSVGRFSKEKRQDILIKALATNKYAKKIKLHLHGLGPRQDYLKKLCASLPNDCEFGFIENSALMQKLKNMNLYVHTAEVESEAISCLEAISLALVPVIADSKISATNQFALDERSLFKTNDIKDLNKKIQYWIENKDELEKMQTVYKNSVAKYELSLCVDKLLQMFDEARKDFKDDESLFARINSLD